MRTFIAMSLCVFVTSSIISADTLTYVGGNDIDDLDGMIDFVISSDKLYRAASGDVPITGLDNGSSIDIDTLLFLDFIGTGANQVSAGSEIVSAILKFWFVNPSDNSEIDIYRLTTSFDSDTTYSGFAGGSGVAGGGTDGYKDRWGSGSGFVTIDVTTEVTSWVEDGTLNYGWGFSQEATNICSWASVFADPDDGHNPTLVVNYTPEPASMTLLALGSLALIRRRRRRK